MKTDTDQRKRCRDCRDPLSSRFPMKTRCDLCYCRKKIKDARPKCAPGAIGRITCYCASMLRYGCATTNPSNRETEEAFLGRKGQIMYKLVGDLKVGDVICLEEDPHTYHTIARIEAYRAGFYTHKIHVGVNLFAKTVAGQKIGFIRSAKPPKTKNACGAPPGHQPNVNPFGETTSMLGSFYSPQKPKDSIFIEIEKAIAAILSAQIDDAQITRDIAEAIYKGEIPHVMARKRSSFFGKKTKDANEP